MDDQLGAPPKSGWAKMVAELHVSDLEASLSFWRGVLGFDIAYQRSQDHFVYLEHPDGAQIMLCRRHGAFETGAMEYPLGQGVLFQVYVDRLDPVLEILSSMKWPLYKETKEVWRCVGDREFGQREVFVQDPDGYLVMIAEEIGEHQ